MVSPKEYFYYLRKAFKKNHIHGYMIDRKANRKTCIYSENGKWVVSEIRRGTAVSPREYDLDDLWHACEDIIARLSCDEEHRKKTWMDWASPTNWAEKMDEPLVAHRLPSEEEKKQENRRLIEEYIPSAYVRTKLFEMEYEFSDSDRAAIIWNSSITLPKKHDELKKIADSTGDFILIDQIRDRIAYDEEIISIFKKNAVNVRDFVYALNSREFAPEKDITGYFSRYELAYEEGCKLGFGFDITKHQVVGKGTQRIPDRIISTPAVKKGETPEIEDLEYYGRGVSELTYDKDGNLRSCWSNEISKEWELLVNKNYNKRFENKFVVFPELFKENDKIRIVEDDETDKQSVGWVSRGRWSYDEFIKHATAEDATDEYFDAALPVHYWDEERLEWDHWHVHPIHMEKIEEEICNSFDEEHEVIVGHDSGAAVWFRVVDVKQSDKILTGDVTEIGREISVHEEFFDRVLRPVFVEAFDVEMPLNKNRYTYAFGDEGRYLDRFEERILEYNFFTYEQMTAILDKIDECIMDGAKRITRAIGGTEIIQLVTFTKHIRRIMYENPNNNVISVMS